MSVIAINFWEIFLGISCLGKILERFSCSFPQFQKSQYTYLDDIR